MSEFPSSHTHEHTDATGRLIEEVRQGKLDEAILLLRNSPIEEVAKFTKQLLIHSTPPEEGAKIISALFHRLKLWEQPTISFDQSNLASKIDFKAMEELPMLEGHDVEAELFHQGHPTKRHAASRSKQTAAVKLIPLMQSGNFDAAIDFVKNSTPEDIDRFSNALLMTTLPITESAKIISGLLYHSGRSTREELSGRDYLADSGLEAYQALQSICKMKDPVQRLKEAVKILPIQIPGSAAEKEVLGFINLWGTERIKEKVAILDVQTRLLGLQALYDLMPEGSEARRAALSAIARHFPKKRVA